MPALLKAIFETGSRRRRRLRRCATILGLSVAGQIASPINAVEAQVYDPRSGASPLSLLKSPADPLQYHRTKERVRALLNIEWITYAVYEGKVEPGAAATAEPLTEKLVRDYPRDPENWLLLATAKKLLKKHSEAAAAYERFGAIAGWDPTAARNAAASHLAAGNKPAALELIRRQILDRGSRDRQFYFTNNAFASLRDDPGFRELVGEPDTTGWTRDEGWMRDLEFLVGEVERVSPKYRGRALPAEFVRLHGELKRNIPTLSNEEILVEMNRLVASLHQGHTEVANFDKTKLIDAHMLPVRIRAFPEGVFIVNAAPEHHDLIGSRIMTIGQKRIAEVLRLAAELAGVDGDMRYLYIAQNVATVGPVLKVLKLLDANGAANLAVENAAGRSRAVSLKPTGNLSWMGAAPPGNRTVDLHLHGGLKAQSEKAVPEHQALYVQFNQVQNGKEESLPTFGTRLNSILRATHPKNIILDMRLNAGGNTALYTNLLRTLIGYSLDAENQIYVLTSRDTASAAANFITELERLGNPIFVGEPPSECCNLNGDATKFFLPYSKIGASISAVKWNLSHPYDSRREISPDVPVQLTAKDYFSGRDTVLETTYQLIADGERGAGTFP
jgi:hypothetical protein